MKTIITTAISAAIVLTASAVLAAPTVSQKCEAGKNKFAGAYYACRAKAEATAIAKGLAADYSKCTTKFGEKWGAAEDAAEAAGGDCPGSILVGDMDAYIADQATSAAAIIGGASIPSLTCGDGAINVAGEHCDGAALDGKTCADFGLHGTLACTAGCDFNLAGCTSCPAPGIEYGGACWFFGAASASCTSTCTAAGLAYDDRTAIIAGSEGSDANCVALLDSFAAPGVGLDNAGGECTSAVGCSVLVAFGFRARCGTPATDGPSIYSGSRRVCACQ